MLRNIVSNRLKPNPKRDPNGYGYADPQQCLEDDVTTHSGVHVEGVLEAVVLINGVLDEVGGPGTLVQGHRCVAQCVARLVCRGSCIKNTFYL
jgi:hypothetical protein